MEFQKVLVCLVLGLSMVSPRKIVQHLSVKNGGYWGQWANRECFPPGEFGRGYTMKVCESITLNKTHFSSRFAHIF